MAKRRQRRKNKQNTWLFPVAAIIILLAITSEAGSNTADSGMNSAALFGLIVLALLGGCVALGFLFYRTSKRQQGLRLLGLDKVDDMTGVMFERWVGEQLRLRGYGVRFTPVNDYGVDIVVTKGGLKTAVQVKRYKRPLDQKPVREAVTGMLHYRCSKSMVVTNSSFTPAAKVLAHSNHCELIDRDKLAEWLAHNR